MLDLDPRDPRGDNPTNASMQLRRRRGGRTQLQMLLLRIARLLLLVWLADALHVRMSAATNPNQWREFRKDQIVQQRAESPTPPMSTPTTVSRGH